MSQDALDMARNRLKASTLELKILVAIHYEHFISAAPADPSISEAPSPRGFILQCSFTLHMLAKPFSMVLEPHGVIDR